MLNFFNIYFVILKFVNIFASSNKSKDMNKKDTLAKKIRERTRTHYQIIADKYNTSTVYVGQIARGVREPLRGKGLKIKQELEKLVS